MAKKTEKTSEKCFIIMPITTPQDAVDRYNSDPEHFAHVLEHLFLPALTNAGFDAVSPKSTGSEVIQAEIISQLASSDVVLCDMSVLNPNVFFEFGVRTALNKPVALIVDDRTEKVPFDTSIVNFHRYSSSLDVWTIDKEINALSEHVRTAFTKSESQNSLWKYFGVSQTGTFKPEESTMEDKIDLLLQEMSALKKEQQEEKLLYPVYGQPGSGKSTFVSDLSRSQQVADELGRQLDELKLQQIKEQSEELQRERNKLRRELDKRLREKDKSLKPKPGD